jgi:hypothetical protein
MTYRVLTILFLVSLLSGRTAQAERVGFELKGSLLNGGLMFGKDVPNNAPVRATFSYDLVVESEDIDSGVKAFYQSIRGGLTYMIGDSLSLSTSEFTIEVGDNFPLFEDEPPVDFLGPTFLRLATPGGPELLVNGAPWSGFARTSTYVYWDQETFNGPDEPKLTTARPVTPNGGIEAFILDNETFHILMFNSIQAIPSLLGDYNRNATVDINDYSEWRNAFGATDPERLYADGDSSQVVDSADYVIWRNLFAGQTLATGRADFPTPEPSSLPIVAVLLIFLRNRTFRTGENGSFDE